MRQHIPQSGVFRFDNALAGMQSLAIPQGRDHDQAVWGLIWAKAYLGLELAAVLTTCEKLKSPAHHARCGVDHKPVHMSRMTVAVPRWHKHTMGFSDKFPRAVSQQGLNSAIGKENVSGPVNDDYGVWTCLVEVSEGDLIHRLSHENEVGRQ